MSDDFFSSETFRLDSSFTDITQEVVVDPGEAAKFLEVCRCDSAHAIALNMLTNAIFSEDLQVKILNEDLKKASITDLDAYFRLFFNPLGKQFFKDRVALGYTCWTYSETEDDRVANVNVTIPVHVQRGRYDISVKTHKDERVEYIACKKGSKTPMDRYYLFIWDPPCPKTGRHNSLIAPLYEEHLRLQKLRLLDDRANHHRSHPVYVLEAVPEGSQKGGEVFTLNGTPFGAQNQETMQQVKLHMAVNESTLAKSLQGPQAIVRTQDGQRVPLYGPGGEENKIFLPHGYKAASAQPPFPEAPADILERTLSYQKLVFANYGIPFSLALGDGKTTSSGGSKQTANLGGEKDFEMFQRGLLQEIRHLQDLYGEVWHHLFPGMTSRGDTRFNLRIIPVTSSGTFHTLFNQGIIHEEALKKRLSQVHGLNDDDIATKENIITRPPLNGTEHHTTSEMKAREDLIRAETKERLAKAESLKEGGSKEEKELIEMNMEFEREKHKLQLDMLRAKLDFEREKLQIQKESLPIEKEQAEIKISMMKEQNKKQKTKSSS